MRSGVKSMNSPRLATICRRMFLGGLSLGVLAASFAAEAQQTTRRPLVGFLCNTTKLARAFGESRPAVVARSEEHTSELQSRLHLVCRLLLEKKKTTKHNDANVYD